MLKVLSFSREEAEGSLLNAPSSSLIYEACLVPVQHYKQGVVGGCGEEHHFQLLKRLRAVSFLY